MKLKYLLGLIVGGSFTALAGAANATCPATPGTPVNTASGCIEITLLPGNVVTVGSSGGSPIYDGIEDTLINVTNLSGSTVGSIHLTANTDIFGFDGDGIANFLPAATGPTGYEGPGTSFANYSFPYQSGDVLFTGGLANLASAYFSLEERVSAGSFTGPIVVNPVPGPVVGAGLPGLVMLVSGLLGWRRMRRKEAIA